MVSQLTTEIKNTSKELLAVIDSFKQEEINIIPFEGSWTAGQVMEHIDKAVFPDILYGKTKPTDRKSDENVAMLRKVFLDFTTKMQSPDFIVPTNSTNNKNELFASLQSKMAALEKASTELDLSLICEDFVVPGSDKFTRMEWLWFFCFHIQRHTHQLKNIQEKLNS